MMSLEPGLVGAKPVEVGLAGEPPPPTKLPPPVVWLEEEVEVFGIVELANLGKPELAEGFGVTAGAVVLAPGTVGWIAGTLD